MADELKSAWELALEKLESQEDMAVEKLTAEQKQAISGIRKTYQARIAEAEIGSQSRIRKALEKGEFDKVESIQQQLAEEKGRLNRTMEGKIEEVRKSGG